jgi:hypothetical protein
MRSRSGLRRCGLAVLAPAACGRPAAARTLAVGPGSEFAAPGEAARAATGSTTVTIAPGT